MGPDGGGESDQPQMDAVNLGRARQLLLFVTISLILIAPRFLYPCGPVFYSPVFVSEQQPDQADAYVSGRLGVPLRTYRGVYAYIAYRYFSGQPLTAVEQKLVLTPPASVNSWGVGFGGDAEDDLKPWLGARAMVPGTPPSPKISMWKQAGEYDYFLNCAPDAFVTAARTLTERAAKYGASNADVKDWIAAQDRVFVQCSAGNQARFGQQAPPTSPLPAETAASAPQWLKQDRAYQIAAANFYAGNFDESHARFLQVASDGGSPWQPWGAYLAGRSLVRKATLKPPKQDQPYDPEVLAQGEAQLKQVLGDPKLQQVHDAARQVLGYVEFRLHPQQREEELGKALTGPHAEREFQQDLKDFLLLVKTTDDPNSDLGRWIRTFGAVGAGDPDEEGDEAPPETKVSAIEEWRQKKTLPWLVLAISAVKPTEAAKDDLIAAARKIPSTSPAYATLVYNEARLAPPDNARKIIDEFLAKRGKELSLSSRNLFLRERLDAAADFRDFMAYAERRPAQTGAEGYGDEFNEFCKADDKNEDCQRAYFDEQAAKVMDLLPLSNWQAAVDEKSFDAKLRQQLALTAWCRAVLLQDWAAADRAARSLRELMPQTAKYIDPFLEATDPAAKKFAAAFAMLHWPGIQPSMADLTLRDTPLNELNNFRMNWWCTFSRAELPESQRQKRVSSDIQPQALAERIVDAKRAAEGRKQGAAIAAGENAPNYLEPAVLAWAKAHRDDPRVPEALHLAVTAGHLSCSTDKTAEYSKQAFTMLHKNYPNSEWARKTKFWYK